MVIISQLSFLSHFKMLLTYYWVRRTRKIHGKTTVTKSLLKLQVDWKRDSNTALFKNTSGRLLCILILFFFELVLYRYSRNNWSIFQVIGFFLLFMSSFRIMKQRHVDKSSKTGRNSDYIDKVFMQTSTLRQLETLFALFL